MIVWAMKPTKACPVILRSGTHILAFRHPKAGCQLVKGTIEPFEDPRHAALRELAEETGINDARIVRDLGIWDPDYEGQLWAMYLCVVDRELPDSWTFHANDDGGHDFAYFWHSITSDDFTAWDLGFDRAVRHIRRLL
jgi:8-oxo-dGTP pyrophosphatase MutT (NUDIX family)